MPRREDPAGLSCFRLTMAGLAKTLWLSNLTYTISCKFADRQNTLADSAQEALAKARKWEAEGVSNVRVTRPDGETMPLSSFEIFSLGAKVGE